MKEDQHRELEVWAKHHLESLPYHRAPAELMARVHRAIAVGEERPVLQRIAAWSPRARLFSAGICGGSLALFIWFGVNSATFSNLSLSAQNFLASITDSIGGAMALVNAVALVLRKIGQPAFLMAFVVFAALAAFCAGVGTACFRFVTAEKEI